MGTDSIYKGCYITIVYNDYHPYGRMVNSYNTLEEAENHIRYQKTHMDSKSYWSILHVKDIEWIKAPEI